MEFLASPTPPSLALVPVSQSLSEQHATALLGAPSLREITPDQIKTFPRLPRSRTAYCYATRMKLHRTLVESEHCEKPERLEAIWDAISGQGLVRRMNRIQVREAIEQEVKLVHSELHWNNVINMATYSYEQIIENREFFERLSLYVHPQTALCARLSLGGALECARALAEERYMNAFAIIRPPGHHAEPEDAMGFCFFNNVAVVAKYVQLLYGESKGIKKVLILDWDVHHGNGTQKAFYDDPSILYISLHRHEGGTFYPNGPAGNADKCGEGEGIGMNVNIPWGQTETAYWYPRGDADYIYAFQQVVMPIAYEFNPDFVIISAGYDAADGDPLGQCSITPAGYAHLTHMMCALAGGKLLMCLEGGYSLEALAASVPECIKVLLGDLPPRMGAQKVLTKTVEDVEVVKRVQAKWWSNLTGGMERREDVEMGDGVEMPLMTTDVTSALIAWRTHELWKEYDMIDVPLNDEKLDNAFKHQVLCTEDVYSADTLVLFMHDMGNLRAEVNQISLETDIEKSYIIDPSKAVLKWAKRRNYGLIDVNVVARTNSLKESTVLPRNDEKKMEIKLAKYIWKQFVGLARATKLVLIGHGTGGNALMNILNTEPRRNKIKACVFVLGFEAPPTLDPYSPEKEWYKNNSLVILPRGHDLLGERYLAGKLHRKYGNVKASDEERPIRILYLHWEEIQEFIKSRLFPPTPPPDENTNGFSVNVPPPILGTRVNVAA
ncbi:Arginase/deacetylase [Atractiella rhizophila]|nr:Arginase/deacetylase [Atractiella rhizophila]